MSYNHQKKVRLQFAGEDGNKDLKFQRSVLWSDETNTGVFGQNDHCYVWWMKGEACKVNTIPSARHRGDSIMSWGCVATKGMVLFTKLMALQG